MFQSDIGPTGYIKGSARDRELALTLADYSGTSVQRPLRATLSILLVCSSSTTAGCPLPRLRSAVRSEMRSPPGRVSSVSGQLMSPLKLRDQS